MPDFNVTCGLTKLTIERGRECVLLLLKKTPSNEPMYYAESSAFYSPIFLPIKGKYDGEGSLCNIVRDANVEFLESRYKKPIENIIELALHSRKIDGILDMLQNKSILDNDLTFRDFLLSLGFKQNGIVYSLNTNFKVFYDEDTKTYTCKYGIFKEYDKKKFLREVGKKSDYLYIKDDYALIAQEVLQVDNCMFILKDAYDFYAKNNSKKNRIDDYMITDIFLQRFGFHKNDKNIWIKDDIELVDCGYYYTINKYKIQTLGDLMMYGHVDLSEFYTSDMIDYQIENAKYSIPLRLKMYMKGIERTDVLNCLTMNEYLSLFDGLLNSCIPWTYLIHVYKREFIYNRDLLTLTGELLRLNKAMTVSNIAFAPTITGTQYGCRLAEEKLNFITQKILGKKEFKEEELLEQFNSRWY